MQDLVIRDVRLDGPRPRGDEVLEVDQNTPINWPIGWVVERSMHYKGEVRVRILCHGIGLVVGASQRPDVIFGKNIDYTVAPGGYALEFCKEEVSLDTVDRFSRWAGNVKWIDIMGCGAAYITAGYEGKQGDGNLLCMKLAQFARTFVRASTARQDYDFKRMIFGRWEGTVLTYGPSGAVVNVENSPAE